MKAIRIHEYGGPEVLRYEDAPTPEPAAGEVLVRVHAAGVNPVDWKIREGSVPWAKYTLPMIPGWDFSGVVDRIGPEVADWKPGDEVYARPDISRNGAYAEYIAVRASEIARKPRTLDHVHSAAIPLAGLTAWQALFDHGGVEAGQKVLIHSAAGGVGTFAVQLAKWKGAWVAATASARNQEFVKQLGADRPIDYEAERFEHAVREMDMVLDSRSGEVRARSWQVLKKGGILVSILGAPPVEEAAAHGVRTAGFLVAPNPAELAKIAELVDSGQVKPVIEAVFPLEQAGKAHELIATGHVRGKVVLKVI